MQDSKQKYDAETRTVEARNVYRELTAPRNYGRKNYGVRGDRIGRCQGAE